MQMLCDFIHDISHMKVLPDISSCSNVIAERNIVALRGIEDSFKFNRIHDATMQSMIRNQRECILLLAHSLMARSVMRNDSRFGTR